MVALPRTMLIERDHEEVVPLKLAQPAGRVGRPGKRVAQGAGGSVEDGGAKQEVTDVAGLTCEHLVSQVVDDEPVAASERLGEAVMSPRSSMPRIES